jgi:hypothetical protein
MSVVPKTYFYLIPYVEGLQAVCGRRVSVCMRVFVESLRDATHVQLHGLSYDHGHIC